MTKNLNNKVQVYYYVLMVIILFLGISCHGMSPNKGKELAIEEANLSYLSKDSSEKVENSFTYLEREIGYIASFWPGEYDNVEQLDYYKAANPKNKSNSPLRTHIFIERVNLPAIGDYVFYIEEYINDDPHQVQLKALYHLVPDKERAIIRIQNFHFKNKKPLLGLGYELNLSTTMDTLTPILEEQCDILVKRTGEYFQGHIDKNCSDIEYNIIIQDDGFKYSELKNQNIAPIEHHLKKARCFVCMIDFPREEGGRPNKTEHYIPIHDQGGKFEFNYSDGQKMVLGMRNTWSFGMQRETFVIFIQEESQNGTTLIYSWGEPGADRIGFNPGWIRVQCDLDTPKNRKLQKELRSDS